MNLEDVINHFCSHSFDQWEQARTAKTSINNGCSLCSQCSHEKSLMQENELSQSLLDIFFSYAEQTGLELLHEDKKWIRTIACDIKFENLTLLLENYIQHWREAMNEEIILHKKQNKGRFVANTFLRETIKYN